jgi:8-oxo-dGTP diphosphatase
MRLPKAAYPDYPRVAVGAVVFNHDRVLLVRRGFPPAKGKWAIPGGSVELAETLQQAAEREILEETGIIIRAGEPIFTFDVIDYDDQERIRFHYVIVDLAAEVVGGELKPGGDALDARWVAGDDLGDLEVSGPTLELLKRRFGFPISVRP